jgi:hypothetical protein
MTELRPTSRLRRFLWIAGSTLLLFTLLGFFVAPSIIKAQLEQRASAALGRTVTVGKVRVNPYAMSVTLEQLDVRLKEGNGSFLGWERLYVNFDPLPSLFGTWTLGVIELDGLHVTAHLAADGKFNFDDILQRFLTGPADAPDAPVPAVHIGSLKVNQARVDFADASRSRPFATTFGPLTFGLTEFRTVGQKGAPYHFAAVTEAGEKLEWTGTVGIEPFRSAGNLALENIDLAKYLAYYGEYLKAEVLAGKLTLRARYALDLTEGARVLKVSEGAMQLRGVKVADAPGGQPAIELPAIDITGVEADGVALKGAVATVSVDGGRLRVQREADGRLNLLSMFEPVQEAPVAGAVPAARPVLPEFLVSAVTVKNFQVDVTDLAAPRAAQLGLSGIELALQNVTLADNAVIPLQLAFNWAPQGTVKLDGTVTLLPAVKADLTVDVAALEIRPVSPYLEQFLNARITQGTFTTAGSAQVALADGPPAIAYAGGVTVEKFGLVDGVANEELMGFGKLELRELKAATTPELRVSLAAVTLDAPYARVIVNADRSVNLLGALKSGSADPEVGGALRPDSGNPAEPSGRKAPPTPSTDPAASAPLPKVEIGQVVITGGEFSLLDRSLEPNVRVAVSQAGGTIGALSSENLARGEINLAAVIDGVAPFTIVGKLDPFGEKRFIELEVDIKNMELLPFSPYSGRYAGYELRRGKLSSNLKFKLDGKQMDAKDIITLNGFTFGAPVASPEATKLPVRLGVALLKDTAGQIVIDVPVSGNIDDPEVRLRKAIMRVVVNLLTKAAVSPFSLLGSIIGGGGEELAFQEFHPGSSELEEAQKSKLETIVKMLNARPELGVAIEGAYDGPADTYTLQRLKVAEIMRGRIWTEKHALDPNIPPPDQMPVTPEEDLAMIKKLFEEKFPPGTEFGAPLAEKPAVSAAPVAEKKPGFLRRVVDTITFKDARTKETATMATDLKEQYAQVKEVAAETGVPVEEMVGRLAQTMEVTGNDLRALAAERATRVRDYFLNEGKIPAERLYLTQAAEAATENKGPRVFLSPQ